MKKFIGRVNGNLLNTGSNSFRNGPDDRGRFGDYGEIRSNTHASHYQLERSYLELRKDNDWEEYETY